ncbi:hypothetical protein MHLP_03210 [Candidatus Mycoplasma haematolamae str. Purdue]|uniref:Uncharacterized protein n=1 Tax=Mycoplasma haematolamae (strain Purdue) TaxID=1212765 RepID=I7C6R4_MYCHA|nr:hypothetical protein [Candidatus Mycoplasma haematolamae]AFO52222.1 hypothetical protein MHLP_03210 [Candidatus Mycoplasma haematolamae str. Purdue]
MLFYSWVNYSTFGIAIIFLYGAFFFFWVKLKNMYTQNLLQIKKELFQLRKDSYFLARKKEVHDEQVAEFISQLQVPKGPGIRYQKLSTTLQEFERQFKKLLLKEEFFLFCKNRILEWAYDLEQQNSKKLLSAIKLFQIRVDLPEKKVEDETESINKDLKGLKERTHGIKNNHNWLVHSFSSYEQEAKERLSLLHRPA